LILDGKKKILLYNLALRPNLQPGQSPI